MEPGENGCYPARHPSRVAALELILTDRQSRHGDEMPLTAAERKLRASVAGLTGWANTADRTARAAHAARGLYEKFYRATDPGLPDDLRARMADSAYRAHLKRMAFRSAQSRRQRKEAAAREAENRRKTRQAESLGGGAA